MPVPPQVGFYRNPLGNRRHTSSAEQNSFGMLPTWLRPPARCPADKSQRGVYDPSCSTPPPPPNSGEHCASRGPANFYTCCAQKEEQGEYDSRQVSG